MGVGGPTHDERSWTLRPRPGRARPGARHRAAAGGVPRPRSRTTTRGITVPAIVDVPTGQVVTNDYAQITLDLSHRVARATTAPGAPDLYPEAPAATRSTRSTTGLPDVNNGVYRCGFAGTQEAYEKAYDRLFDRLDWLAERLRRPALPGRRHDHRGRRAAVHHAGPLRRRLPRPLQVQPAEADRDAGAVGVRPRPVPDARASATPSTSSTSSGTTTRSTATSTRPASCRPARTCPAG